MSPIPQAWAGAESLHGQQGPRRCCCWSEDHPGSSEGIQHFFFQVSFVLTEAGGLGMASPIPLHEESKSKSWWYEKTPEACQIFVSPAWFRACKWVGPRPTWFHLHSLAEQISGNLRPLDCPLEQLYSFSVA